MVFSAISNTGGPTLESTTGLSLASSFRLLHRIRNVNVGPRFVSGCYFWRSLLSPFCCDEDQDPSPLLLLVAAERQSLGQTCHVLSLWRLIQLGTAAMDEWSPTFSCFCFGGFFFCPPPPPLLPWLLPSSLLLLRLLAKIWRRRKVLTCLCGNQLSNL